MLWVSRAFGIPVLVCVAMAGGATSAQPSAPAPPTAAGQTQQASDSTPREVIEAMTTQIVGVLKDPSLSRSQRGERLDGILRRRMDFATLSRLMLGREWEQLSAGQQKAFIDELSTHLLGVYLPMTDGYSGQQVRVIDERPEANGDCTVQVAISDVKGNAVNQVATVACRLRRGEDGWKAIDMRVEGISVAVLFRSQFRPVMVRDGFDALLQRLREKNAQGTSAQVKG